MAYTTTGLVKRSWYLTGIVSPELQTVTGAQLNEGVSLLNALLAIKTAENRLIPYYKQLNLTSVIGQEGYFIENLIDIQTLTFTDGPLRYPMVKTMRKTYFGTGRVNNIESLPFSYHFERELNGSRLYVYFLPVQNFPLQLWGKFSLNDVVLGQDLELTIDAFYIEYLRIALAEYICSEYNINLQPQTQKKLDQYEAIITDISPQDFSVNKVSTLTRQQGMNYAQVNIGRGFTPP